jgi:leucyl aminopeptidase
MKIKLVETFSDLEVIVIPVFSDNQKIENEDFNIVLEKLKESEKFEGKFNEQYTYNFIKNGTLKKYIFLGFGKSQKLTLDKARIAMSKIVDNLKKSKDKKAYINLIENQNIQKRDMIFSMIEGLLLSDYSYDKYKNDKENLNIEIEIGIKEPINDEYKNLKIEASELVKANLVARNLVNEPANSLIPETLAKNVKNYAKEFGFEAEIFDLEKIEELKMDAFLSVSKGSENEPKLIVMRYLNNPKSNEEILGLVGKGLTYDSGGYSIKSTEGMVTMKSDMGGAAAVIGAMCSIAKQNLKVNVVAVVAACENLISGKSYKPGDIIDSMAGKTIEVLNTDAEGRLTLADAVYYSICKEKVTKIVDIATLTGAAVIALGDTTTAALTNDNDFFNIMKKSSEITGEKVWELPSYEEYSELLKSKIADLKNIGGRKAGTITAGLFIKEFIKDIPWIHLDIAGTSWSDTKKDYYSIGGTGVGVRLLYQFVKKLQ